MTIMPVCPCSAAWPIISRTPADSWTPRGGRGLIEQEQRPAPEGRLADGLANAELEMIPLHRIADPEEIGQIVVWFISDFDTYATGAEFDITGGLALH